MIEVGGIIRLTYQAQDVDSGRDRPAIETEITPEMIAAGVGALVAYDERFDLEEDAVVRIYTAMIRAVRKERGKGTIAEASAARAEPS
jgi:hypothetical protein